MASLSDLSLVTQVTVFHNRRAFDQLVVKYQLPIRRFLLNLTKGDEMTSDDLAQETFIKAYTHLSQFRATASFSTWLFRIAYNVFYDYTRKKDLVTMSNPKEGSDGPFPSGHTETGALSYDLQRALSILSANERLCVTLQLIEGRPIDEIASITEMPVGTVKSHLSRGKEKLAKFLRKNGYESKHTKR